MREYPKTQNLFARDPDTHQLIVGELRDPAHAQIARWLVTEKVDGTNIRVLLRLVPETESVFWATTLLTEVRGRSDNANLPPGLEQQILHTLRSNEATGFAWMKELTGEDPDIVVCLYGEGYGAGVQKNGGSYRPKEDGKSFRLFDVTTSRVEWDGDTPIPVGTWWRDWETVCSAATAFGLETVPELSSGSDIGELTEAVGRGFTSTVAAGNPASPPSSRGRRRAHRPLPLRLPRQPRDVQAQDEGSRVKIGWAIVGAVFWCQESMISFVIRKELRKQGLL